MSVFQMLSAGNIGQFGAPGTGVPSLTRAADRTRLAEAAPPLMLAAMPAMASAATTAVTLRTRRRV
jgi:hypothetical protein